MAVYIDRNIFHIGATSYENDGCRNISLETSDYSFNNHVNAYFEDDTNVDLDTSLLSADKKSYNEVREWPNGDSFHGNFFDRKRNAWGFYQWDNGEKYFGTFFNDKNMVADFMSGLMDQIIWVHFI
ncbi:unnamed protein product [Heterobilharzia americana]|nr:unnamed protein product [Heterobilharzia americana]